MPLTNTLSLDTAKRSLVRFGFALSATAVSLFAMTDSALAQDAAGGGGQGAAPPSDLAQQATNPASALTQLQFQAVYQPGWDRPNVDGGSGEGILQPVIPIALNPDWYFNSLIIRMTLPIIIGPDPKGPVSSTDGIGDLTSLFVPTNKGKLSEKVGYTWGPIGAVVAPTSSNGLGTDSWQLGGGILGLAARKDLLRTGDVFQFGAYGYNVWDVSGSTDVNQLYAGPVIVYHFADLFDQKGWYVRSSDDLMTWDWNNDGDKASLPVGVGLGRVFSMGKQPVNMFFSYTNFVKRRGATATRSEFKLNFTLLLP